ncbi:MAG: DUF3047 domain-containing protein [Candidatus Aureabacteria bacterium]|nr:DUF3047 domain-containing protein [Candidatus Auribacterota bacterium]
MSTARTLLTLAMCCAFSSILRAAAGGTPVPIAPPAITVTPGHDLAAAGWREKVYRTGNLWEALYKDGLPALRCTSNRSASMLYRTVHYNARDFPLLRWQWRVERLPLRSGELTRANDDYAARIYVFFPGWTFLGSRVLEYVWDTDAAAGTIRTSPTSNRCKHLVVASGNSSPGTWVTVEGEGGGDGQADHNPGHQAQDGIRGARYEGARSK